MEKNDKHFFSASFIKFLNTHHTLNPKRKVIVMTQSFIIKCYWLVYHKNGWLKAFHHFIIDDKCINQYSIEYEYVLLFRAQKAVTVTAHRHSQCSKKQNAAFGPSFRHIHNWIYMRYYDKTIKKKNFKSTIIPLALTTQIQTQTEAKSINTLLVNGNSILTEDEKNERRWEEHEEEKSFYVQSNHGIILISFWRTAETSCLFR